MEEGLQEVKLNFFQKLRKSFYLSRMTTAKANKYLRLPDYLRNDDEVIDAVVAASNYMIANVPVGKAADLIKNYPELITNIYDINEIVQIINMNPEAVRQLSTNQKNNLVFNYDLRVDKQFIKYLSHEEQKALLVSPTTYNIIDSSVNGTMDVSQGRKERRGSITSLSLKDFSPEVIIGIALEDEKIAQENGTSVRMRLSTLQIKELPEKTQLKLFLVNKIYMDYASPESLKKYVGNNPLLIGGLRDRKMIDEILKDQPDLIKFMPFDVQRTAVSNHSISFKDTSIKNFSYFRVTDFPNVEDCKRRLLTGEYITHIFGNDEWNKITDIRNDDYIWEMAKFDPKFARLSKYITVNNLAEYKRNNALANSLYVHAKDRDPNGKLSKVLYDYSKEKNQYGTQLVQRNENVDFLNNLTLLMTNDDVMAKVSDEELLKYATNPSHDKLVEIVRKTYGDKSAKILEDRPGILDNGDNVPNLYIYSPEIVNEFGIGAVHATMSYEMHASSVFSELARKPELMEEYKKFNKLAGPMFKDTAIDLDRKLIAFMGSRELFKDIDRHNLTDDQIKNIDLAFTDMFSKAEPKVMELPTSVKELDEYRSKRNKIYDEAIEKSTDINEIKEFLSQRYFGMNYKTDTHVAYLKDNSVKEMCDFYSLSDFTQDKKTIESGNFTQDELDTLELLDIISSINDPKILKEMSKVLSSKEEVINPSMMKRLKEKVPLQYSKDLVSSLMTVEKAEEMVREGKPGIKIEEKDGIKIIKLSGADYKAYVTNPYLNNSNIKRVSSDSVLETWQEFEGGISTFSGCLIDQDENTSCVSHGSSGLGFFSINPNQIVGMGSTDIHVSHMKKQLEPNTTENTAVKFDYADTIMKKTSRRLNGDDQYSDPMHHYNEVASSRRVEELSSVEEGTFGGKTMPDYLYTCGKDTGVAYLEQAKKMGLKVIIEVDDEAYRGRSWQRGFAPEEKKQKKGDSEFISEVKTKVNGDDKDDR